MLRQSRHSRSFSHFSTASPGAYRIDSCRETSCSVRAAPRKKHTHSEKQLLHTLCLKERGKCSTLSLSQRAHVDMAGECELSGLKLFWRMCSLPYTVPKALAKSMQPRPEMGTNKGPATRRPVRLPSGHWLATLWRKATPALESEPDGGRVWYHLHEGKGPGRMKRTCCALQGIRAAGT